MALRDAFPVLSRLAYMNAGTDGPVPTVAADAAKRALDAQLEEGRYTSHFEARMEGGEALRAACARVLRCEPAEVALTTSTSEGLGKVIAALDLGPDDEILMGDDEHPGLIGPVLAQRSRGVKVRTAPVDRIASFVSRETSLVACSHVSWNTGRLVDPAISDVEPFVVLDGAQAAGAIDVDVGALGCNAYAAAGQKWLCGADGTGMLWLDPDFVEPLAPGYMAFADASKGLESTLHEDSRRHDTASLARESVAFTTAAIRLLEDEGLAAIHARGTALASQLADMLRDRGHAVAPRDATTLVSWEDEDPQATAERLYDAGIVVRFLPGTPYLRASVGAWNDESDLERLLAAL